MLPVETRMSKIKEVTAALEKRLGKADAINDTAQKSMSVKNATRTQRHERQQLAYKDKE